MDTDIDGRAMKSALASAQLAAAQGEVPVGAVVMRDGVILGQGHNLSITNCDPTAHAEIIAMRQAAAHLKNYRLTGCTLYVTLEPCAMCAMAMIHARMERVVFAACDPKSGAILSCEHLLERPWVNHTMGYHAGLMADESQAMLQEFFALKRDES